MGDEAGAEVVETPYALARRLHTQGVDPGEIERQLKAMGLSTEDAHIAARAARGEAGAAPGVEAHRPVPAMDLPSEPPADAPSHPCPRHPAWPVAGTCSRCGNFFCTRCLVDAGFTRLLDSKQCPDCERRAPVAAGISGWLVLPAIAVSVGVLGTTIGLVQEAIALPEVDASLLPPVLVGGLYNLVTLAYTVFTAISFFKRKRIAVRLMIGFYALGMVDVLVNALLFAWMEHLVGSPLEGPEAVQSVRPFIAGAIWIGYFLSSKRVKETFVVD